jgi:type II secretory pathway component PulK
MARGTRRTGFALLMSLVLVLLMGTVLAGLAWRSMTGALEARGAAEELQRRWAVTSLRAALLDHVEELLSEAELGDEKGGGAWQAEKQPRKAVAAIRVTCQLAGEDYELVLTDEQAKLNVNALMAEAGRVKAQAIVARLAAASDGQSGQNVAMNLRAVTASKGTPNAKGLSGVGAYGQVFEAASPESLVGDGQTPGLADAITCWGSGRVNVRRASDAVLAQACERVLGRAGARDLLAARRKDPFCELPTMLGQLAGTDDKQRQQLRGCLTDQSTCHGLWVIARGEQRSWFALAVGMDQAGTSGPAGVKGSTTQKAASSAGGPAAKPADGGSLRRASGNRYLFTW